MLQNWGLISGSTPKPVCVWSSPENPDQLGGRGRAREGEEGREGRAAGGHFIPPQLLGPWLCGLEADPERGPETETKDPGLAPPPASLGHSLAWS